jgi:hypothetical protein
MGRVGGPLQQIVLRFAPEYVATFGDRMPPWHRRALFDIAACRTDAMGGHTVSRLDLDPDFRSD